MGLVLLVLVVEEAGVAELLEVRLGRLVDIHIRQLLSCLFSGVGDLSLFSRLFGCLDFLKLVKDVLVVQQRV